MTDRPEQERRENACPLRGLAMACGGVSALLAAILLWVVPVMPDDPAKSLAGMLLSLLLTMAGLVLLGGSRGRRT